VAYGPAQAYPPQPGMPTGAGGTAPWMNPAWLAASADRERAVGVLRAGFAEGRLSQDELDDRVARAYTARTYGELWALTADLPAGPFAPSYGPVAVTPVNAAEVRSWRPAAALIITALIIFTLAALITAIVTTHVSGAVPGQYQGVPTVPLQQVPMPALPPGAQQQVVLTPYVVHVPGEWNGHHELRALPAP
jgi:DUF1707 SHOCT-like domain